MSETRADGRRALTYCAFATGVIVASVAAGVVWTRKWALQVMYTGGTTDYLRNGRSMGEGPVAWFRFRRDAEEVLAALRPALADNVAVRVVRYRRRCR
ncbi:MAG: hypothetical protein IT176_00685 [Acidobacteria bacterium]|nr:hypothetical protein [Acidobacteriota bacterium]